MTVFPERTSMTLRSAFPTGAPKSNNSLMTGFYFLRVGEIQGLKCRTGFSPIRPPEAVVWTTILCLAKNFAENLILCFESRHSQARKSNQFVDILSTVIESSYSFNLLHKAPGTLSFYAKAVEKSAVFPRAVKDSLGPVAFSTVINRALQ